MDLLDKPADGRERDGTADMEQAEVADFHTTIGQDMLEEAAEKLHDVEVGGAGAGTADFPVGESDGTVLEAYDAAVGDGNPEDVGGEGGEGGMARVIGLTVDVPRDGPHLGIDVLQQSGLAHLFFEERTVDRGEGFDGDKEVGAGRVPSGAVLREAFARNDVVDMGVVLQLPAPGVQDLGESREVCPDEALVVGQPFEGRC